MIKPRISGDTADQLAQIKEYLGEIAEELENISAYFHRDIWSTTAGIMTRSAAASAAEDKNALAADNAMSRDVDAVVAATGSVSELKATVNGMKKTYGDKLAGVEQWQALKEGTIEDHSSAIAQLYGQVQKINDFLGL